MSDTIGRISVPSLVSSGQTFPLTSDVSFGFSQDRPVVVHRFGELDAKAEQRFAVGLGPRKFPFRRQHLSKRDRNLLITFWEGIQGAWQSSGRSPDRLLSRRELSPELSGAPSRPAVHRL
jgi:hypothetical protein